MAAGFWQSTLSPLHGALIAATIARGGKTPPSHLVERVVDGTADARAPSGGASARVVTEETAQRRRPHDGRHHRVRHGAPRLPRRRRAPAPPPHRRRGQDRHAHPRAARFLAYSWFVGFAPARKPEVAVAVLLGNGQDWKVKAGQVARELLSGYFRSGRSMVAAR